VSNNTVVSAGNSAFGAMGFDPLQNRSAGAPDFTGSAISNNTLWSGPNTHFIIGLAVGSRPWYGDGSIGHGAAECVRRRGDSGELDGLSRGECARVRRGGACQRVDSVVFRYFGERLH